VERVADGSATLGVGAAAALLVLGSPGLANGALAAAAAKAARGGRECFAAQRGRDAAGRRSLVLDRAVPCRLDRVDTVVLDGEILRTGRHVVADVLPSRTM
jgi:cation-transporting ATPase I